MTDTALFARFAPTIRSLSAAELDNDPGVQKKLELARSGDFQVCYAPFEYINPAARVVLVGITPGKAQMLNALREARRQLELGADSLQAIKAAKRVGAFSGALRPNLIRLLDAIGINQWLGLATCGELFGSAAGLVQTASVLRFPVFYRGENYSGTPGITRVPFLRENVMRYFVEDAKALPHAVFVPLGKAAADTLELLVHERRVDKERLLLGLPHPSGANAERIAYFLQSKPAHAVSRKTSTERLDSARDALRRQVANLPRVQCA